MSKTIWGTVLVSILMWVHQSVAYSLYFNSFPPAPSFSPNLFSSFSPYIPPSRYYSSLFLPSQPAFNFFAEPPYSIANRLATVPLYVVPQNRVNVISQGHIKGISKKRPMITVQTSKNVIQCTPAVRVVLEQPIVVTSMKTEILFPAEMSVLYDHFHIPIQVGAVIAPVSPDIVATEQDPLNVNVVYAIPAQPIDENEIDVEADVAFNKPVKPPMTSDGDSDRDKEDDIKNRPSFAPGDYVNNEKDVKIDPVKEAVIVENTVATNGSLSELSTSAPSSENEYIPPVASKPEPVISEEGENADNELVNRNPPVFQNPKESPVLNELREQAKKERL